MNPEFVEAPTGGGRGEGYQEMAITPLYTIRCYRIFLSPRLLPRRSDGRVTLVRIVPTFSGRVPLRSSTRARRQLAESTAATSNYS